MHVLVVCSPFEIIFRGFYSIKLLKAAGGLPPKLGSHAGIKFYEDADSGYWERFYSRFCVDQSDIYNFCRLLLAHGWRVHISHNVLFEYFGYSY